MPARPCLPAGQAPYLHLPFGAPSATLARKARHLQSSAAQPGARHHQQPLSAHHPQPRRSRQVAGGPPRMNALLGSLLSSVIGKYIEPEGLRTINFTFSGEVRLRNLAVRPEALDALDLPFKIKHGSVGSIALTIPGGLTGFLSKVYTEPVRVRIDDVHVLIDKAPQTPGELARKRAVQQQAALDIDAISYRQQLIELLEAEVARAGGGGGGGGGGKAASSSSSKRPPGGIQAAILRNLQIEINGFHLRYEDVRSQADAPFALGVTFASFSTSAGGGGGGGSGGAPVPGVVYRSARLQLASVYLDPLAAHGEFGKLASGPGGERAAAFAAGVATAAPTTAQHRYLLAPTSPELQLALNLDGRVAGEPSVRAGLRVASLALVATRGQASALLFLQAWLEEDRFKQVARALRAAGRPGVRVGADARAWWRYAKALALGLLRRHRDDSGLKRWDAARVCGALARRRAYITAYRKAVLAEARVIRKAMAAAAGDAAAAGAASAPGASSPSSATAAAPSVSTDAYDKALKELDPAAGAALAAAEGVTPLECLLEWRAEARLDVEEALAAGREEQLVAAAPGGAGGGGAGGKRASTRGSGGSWMSWLSSSSSAAPAPPSPAADAAAAGAAGSSSAAAAGRAAAVRTRFEEAKRGGATAVALEVSAELVGASLRLEAAPGTPLLTVAYSGSAAYTAMRGKAFRARLQLHDVRAVDEVTRDSAFRAVLVTARRGAAVAAAAPPPPLLALCDAPDAAGSAPAPASAPLVDVAVDAFPPDRADSDYVVRVTTQPLTLVVAPQLLRGLAAFAYLPDAAGVGAELNARARVIASQVGSDVYGALAAHSRIDVAAHVAAPALLLPDDLSDAGCRRLLVNLGDLAFTSAAATVRVADEDRRAEEEPDATTPQPPASGSAGSGSASSQQRRVASAVDEASFDTWRLRVDNVAVVMQPRAAAAGGPPGAAAPPALPLSGAAAAAGSPYDTDARPRQPVIEPIALDLTLQTCVLPASVAPNRLRVKGRLPRLAVSVSLPFALQLGGLNKQLLAVLAGMQADGRALQAEYDASNAANRRLESALEAAAGGAPAPALPALHKGAFAPRASPPAKPPPPAAKPPPPAAKPLGGSAASATSPVRRAASAGVGPAGGGSSKPHLAPATPAAATRLAGPAAAALQARASSTPLPPSPSIPSPDGGGFSVSPAVGSAGSGPTRRAQRAAAASPTPPLPPTTPHNRSAPPAPGHPAAVSMAGVYVVDFSFDELELRLLDVRTSARRMVRKLRARARAREGAALASSAAAAAAGDGADEDGDGPPGAGDDSVDGAMTARSTLVDDEAAGAALAGAPPDDEELASTDLVFTMRSLHSGIEYSTDAIGLSASLRSVDVDDYYQRAGRAFKRLVGTTAAPEATGPVRAAAAGSSSPATNAAAGGSRKASSDLTELIRVRVQQKALPNRAAGEVPLAASLQFSSLHIGYNPETVAALQLYGLYLVECAFGGAAAAPPTASEPTLSDALVAGDAATASKPASPEFAVPATTESQASYFSMLESLVSNPTDEHDDEDDEAEAMTGDVTGLANTSTLVAALTKMRITAELSEVTLTMHKERMRRKVAVLGVSGLRAAVDMDVEGGLAVDASLSNVYLRDLCTAGSKYPMLLSIVEEGGERDASSSSSSSSALSAAVRVSGSGSDAASERQLLRLRFASFVKQSPRYPGYDSAVLLSLSPVRAVLLHAPLMEVLDYASSGLLSTLLTSAVASASAAIADTVAAQAQAASRMLLDVSLAEPRVVVPVSSSSDANLSLSIAAVRVTNSFVVEAPSADDDAAGAAIDRSVDHMSVAVTGLNIGTFDGTSSCPITKGSPLVNVHLSRPLSAAYRRQPGLDVAVTVPAIRLGLSRVQYLLLLRILDENVGAAAAEAAAIAAAAASAQEQVSLAMVPEEDGEEELDDDDDDEESDDVGTAAGLYDLDSDLQVAYGYGAASTAAASAAAEPQAGDAAAQSPGPTMRARVRLLEDVSLTLYESVAFAPGGASAAASVSTGLVSFALRTMDLSYSTAEDATRHISFSLKAIDVKDIREAGAASLAVAADQFRRIIRQRPSTALPADRGPEPLTTTLDADVVMAPDGATGITVGAGPLQLVVAPHFLSSLVAFVMPPSVKVSAGAPHSAALGLSATLAPAIAHGPTLSAAPGRPGKQLGDGASARSRASSLSDRERGLASLAALSAAPPTAKPSSLRLTATLRGVTLVVPEQAARADCQCLVIRAEACATLSDARTPGGDVDGIVSLVTADAAVQSLWAAIVRVGSAGVGEPDSDSAYIIRPATFRGTYTATTRADVSAPPVDAANGTAAAGGMLEASPTATGAGDTLHPPPPQPQRLERLVTFDADQLNITLGYQGLVCTALSCFKDVQASGLLALLAAGAPQAASVHAVAPPPQIANPRPGKGSRRGSIQSTSSGPSARAAGTGAAAPPTPAATIVTVVDRVAFSWRGLQVSILDDVLAAATSGDEAAPAPHPAGLVSASVGDVQLQVQGTDGLYALSGNFSITADTWDADQGGAWRPLVLQPWRFGLKLAQAKPSDAVAALAVDLRAATPLEVLLLDSTLREVLCGVTRWQVAATELGALIGAALPAGAVGGANREPPTAPGVAPASDPGAQPTSDVPPPLLRWCTAARETDFSASLSIPVVCVDLVATVPHTGAGCTKIPLTRVALLQAELELTLARIVGLELAPAVGAEAGFTPDEAAAPPGSPPPTIAHEVRARVRTSALHAFDLVNAHVPGFGLLVTSTPAVHAQLEATSRPSPTAASADAAGRRGAEAQLRLLTAQQADIEARGGRKLIDIEYSSQTRPAPPPPGTSHPPLPAPFNTTDENTGKATSDVRVRFDVLHVEFNAGTVKRLMRYLGSLAPPPSPGAAAPASTAAAAAAKGAPAATAAGPATLTLPSTLTAMHIHVVIRMLSMSMNKDTAAEPRKVARVAARGLVVGLLLREEASLGVRNGNTFITGSLSDVTLTDSCTIGTRYQQLIGRQNNRQLAASHAGSALQATSPPDSGADAVVTFEVHTYDVGCDVGAGATVAAFVAPLDIVFLNAQIMEVLDFLLLRLLGALVPPPDAAALSLVAAGQQAALAHARSAHGRSQPASLVTSLCIEVAGPRIIAPVTAHSLEALVVAVKNVSIRTTVGSIVPSADSSRRSSSAPGASPEDAATPSGVIHVTLSNVRADAIVRSARAGGAALQSLLAPLPELVIDFSQPLLLHEGAHLGKRLSIALAPLVLGFSHGGYTVLRGVLDFNLGSKPLTTDDIMNACDAIIPHSPPLERVFDPEAAACGCCGGAFGCAACGDDGNSSSSGGGGGGGGGYGKISRMARLCCGLCGRTVCSGCLLVNASLYDSEAKKSHSPCRACVAALAAARPRETQLGQLAQMPGGIDGTPMTIDVTLASVALLVGAPASPIASLQLCSIGVCVATKPLVGHMAVDVSIGSFSLVNEGADAATVGSEQQLASPSHPGMRLLVAPNPRALFGRPESVRATSTGSETPGGGRADAAAGVASAVHSQLHLTYTSSPAGQARLGVVLNGCDINPEVGCLMQLGAFFGKYAPATGHAAPAVDAAPIGAAPRGGAEPTTAPLSTLPPLTARAAPTQLQIDLHISRPRLLLLRDPRNPHSDAFVASFTGQVRLTLDTADIELCNLALGDASTSAFSSVATAGRTARARRQRGSVAANVKMYELELFRTRLDSSGEDDAAAAAAGLQSFGAISGARRAVLKPVNMRVAFSSSTSSITSVLGDVPAAEAAVCIASRRPPSQRTTATVTLDSGVSLCATGVDALVLLDVLARYSAPPPAAGGQHGDEEEDEEEDFDGDDGPHSESGAVTVVTSVAELDVTGIAPRRAHAPSTSSQLTPAELPVSAASPPSARQPPPLPLLDALWPLPTGWHPSDYEVTFPPGLQMGLKIIELCLGPQQGGSASSSRRLLSVAVVPQVDLPPTSAASTAPASFVMPRFDAGSGVQDFMATPAAAAGVIAPGDLLVAVNDMSLAEASREQAINLIKSVKGTRVLRMRAMPFALALCLDAAGVEITAVNNLQGRNDEVLRVRLAPPAATALGGVQLSEADQAAWGPCPWRFHGDVASFSLRETLLPDDGDADTAADGGRGGSGGLDPVTLAVRRHAQARRPALASFYAHLAARLSVDVFRVGGAASEPLVEPFLVSVESVMVDAYHKTDALRRQVAARDLPGSKLGAKSVLRRLDFPLRALFVSTTRIELNASLDFLRPLLTAQESWSAAQRQSRELAAATGASATSALRGGMEHDLAQVAEAAAEVPLNRPPLRGSGGGGSLLLSGSPAGIFPYILRNKTGVRLAVAVHGMDRERLTLFSSVAGGGESAAGASAAGSASSWASAPSHREIDATDPFAVAAASLDAVVVPAGTELGFAMAARKYEFGQLQAGRSVENAPSGGGGSGRGVGATRSVDVRLEGCDSVLKGVGIDMQGVASTPLQLAPGVGATSLPASINVSVDLVDGRRVITLRSLTQLRNLTAIDLHVYAAMHFNYAGGPLYIGLAPAGGALSVPLTVAAGASGLRVRPVLPTAGGAAAAGGSGGYLLSQPIPLTGSEAGEVVCDPRPDGAPSSRAATGGAAPPPTAPSFFLVTRVTPRRRGAYYTLTLHAPLRLTNLLPLPARFQLQSGGAQSSTIELAPGGSTDVHSVGGTGLAGAAYLDDGTKAAAASRNAAPPRFRMCLVEPAAAGHPHHREDAWSDPRDVRWSGGGALDDECMIDVSLPQPATASSAGSSVPATVVKLAVQPARPDVHLHLQPHGGAEPADAAAAAAAAASESSPPTRLDLEVFAPHWLVNVSGLPLVYGQKRPVAGDVYGSCEDISQAPVGIGQLGSAAGSQVYEELWESQRHYGPLVGWKEPGLPSDPPAWSDVRTGVAISREAVEKRVASLAGGSGGTGWHWLTPEWQMGPWDHAFDFSYFKKPSRTAEGGQAGAAQLQLERRGTDNVRRRRWSRVRQLVPTPSADDASSPMMMELLVPRAGLFPGCQVRHTPGASSPRIVSGAALPFSPARAAASSSSAAPGAPHASSPPSSASSVVLFSPHDDKLYLRFASGAWAPSPVELGGVATKDSEAHVTVQGPRLRGVASDGSRFESNLAFPLCVASEAAPGEFGRRTTVVRLAPHYVLVNATSQPLYYRQAGRGASPIATSEASTWPEHELPPFSHAPVWLQRAADVPCLQFSPAAARGGWGPPVPLPTSYSGGGDGAGTGVMDVPLSITVPDGAVPYVRTLLGVTPTASVVIGVSVRANESVAGGRLVVVTQQSQPYALLRPPLEVLTGGAVERDHVALALTTDCDLKAAAEDRRRQLAALTAAAAAGGGGGFGARSSSSSSHPMTPARAASKAALLSPASSSSHAAATTAAAALAGWPAEDYIALPYLAVINHSRCTLGFHQKQPRMFDHTGETQPHDVEEALFARLRAERHGSRVYGDGAPSLGVCYAAAIHYAAPRSVVPVGLVDAVAAAAAGAEGAPPSAAGVRLTFAVMDGQPSVSSLLGGGGGASGSSRPRSAFGAPRVINLDHVGRVTYLLTPSGRGVVAQVRVTGASKVVVLHDDGPIRAAIGRVLLSDAAPGGGSAAGGGPRRGSGDSWTLLDAAAAASQDDADGADADGGGGGGGALTGEDGTTAADVLALSDPWAFGHEMDVRVQTDAAAAAAAAAAGAARGGGGPSPAGPPSGGATPPGTPAPPAPSVLVWEDLLRVDVEGVGVSIIDGGVPDELFYASLDGLAASVHSGSKDATYRVALSDLQLDDLDRKAGFPVILARQRRARPASAADSAAAAPLFALSLCLASQYGAVHIKRAAGALVPLRLGVTTEVVFKAWGLAQRALKIQATARKLAVAAAAGSGGGGGGRAAGAGSAAPPLPAAEAAAGTAKLLAGVSADRTFDFLADALAAATPGAAGGGAGGAAQQGATPARRGAARGPDGGDDDAAAAGAPARGAARRHTHRASAFSLTSGGAPQTPAGASTPPSAASASAALAALPLPQRDSLALIDALVRGGAARAGSARHAAVYAQAVQWGAPLEVAISLFSTGRKNDLAEEQLRRVPLVLRDLVKALLRGASFADLPLRVLLPAYHARFVTPAQMEGDVERSLRRSIVPVVLSALSSLVGVSTVTSALRNVADGAVSGLDRTATGLLSGDLVGAASGVGSMLSNTVSSVVGGAASVTGTVGNMASALAGGEGNVRTNKPTDVFSGVGKGVADIGKGLFRGVTGVVTKPMEGLRRGGLEGMAKGAVQGLVGVVAAPVGGVVTGVTRVLQGVEGTLQSRELAEARREETTRVRAKRAFYGVDPPVIRAYSRVDAEWAARLRTLSGGAFAGERLVYVETALREPSVAVLVTVRTLLVARATTGGDAGGGGSYSLVRQLPLQELLRADGSGEELVLRSTGGTATLRCASAGQAAALAGVLMDARHHQQQ